MDQSSAAGHMDPASLSDSVESVVSTTFHEGSLGLGKSQRQVRVRNPSYQVADLFGRCFLRVCYWVEVFSSFTRRGEPVPYTALPKRTVASLQTPGMATQVPELISEQADSVLSASSKTVEA